MPPPRKKEKRYFSSSPRAKEEEPPAASCSKQEVQRPAERVASRSPPAAPKKEVKKQEPLAAPSVEPPPKPAKQRLPADATLKELEAAPSNMRTDFAAWEDAAAVPGESEEDFQKRYRIAELAHTKQYLEKKQRIP